MTFEQLRREVWWRMWQPRLDTWPPSPCGQPLHDKIVAEARSREWRERVSYRRTGSDIDVRNVVIANG